MDPASNDAEEIREQMRRVRAHLRADVRDLVEVAREKTDWRHYVRTYPWMCLGAAAAVGYWVAGSRPRLVAVDETAGAIPAGSHPLGTRIRTGVFAGSGFASSLIRAAANALLIRGLEALSSHAAVKWNRGSGDEAPSQIQTDVSEPW